MSFDEDFNMTDVPTLEPTTAMYGSTPVSSSNYRIFVIAFCTIGLVSASLYLYHRYENANMMKRRGDDSNDDGEGAEFDDGEGAELQSNAGDDDLEIGYTVEDPDTVIVDQVADATASNAGNDDLEIGSQNQNSPDTVEDPDTVTIDQVADVDDDRRKKMINDAKIEATRSRVQQMFPGVTLSLPRNIKQLKYELNHTLLHTIAVMDPETSKRLNRRENAAEFCKALGMNEELVDIKFRAHAAFEEETGIQIKVPVLKMVQHLIDNIDNDNPFGEINNKVETNYKGKEWLDYLGVPLKKGFVKETIQNVEAAAAITKDHFLHGTTSMALQGIFKENGHIYESIGQHDFGMGVYCMLGHLNRALSWGIALAWPEFDTFKEAKGAKNFGLLKKNPAVVLFRNEKGFSLNAWKTKKIVFHVGVDKYPVNKRFIIDRLAPEDRQNYMDQQLWKDSSKKWEHFVKVARLAQYVPNKKRVFHGLLHDCYTVGATDDGGVPQRDKECWDQICFKDVRGELGLNKLFIEFFLDWESWGEGVETAAHFEAQKEGAADGVCVTMEFP